jgi:Zn-dependent protease
MSDTLPILPALLFSVVVHELAHGWVALRLGDPTARDAGRLTLNPIPHIDLFGSILVPAISLLATGRVFIAWAKPVPINPAYFRIPRRDSAVVSIAGPFSNLILAILLAIGTALTGWAGRMLAPEEGTLAAEGVEFILRMCYGGMYVNVGLAVFNLMPIPPLDGSHLVAAVLPLKAAELYVRVGFAGVLAFVFLLNIPAFSEWFGALIDLVATPYNSLVTFLLTP